MVFEEIIITTSIHLETQENYYDFELHFLMPKETIYDNEKTLLITPKGAVPSDILTYPGANYTQTDGAKIAELFAPFGSELTYSLENESYTYESNQYTFVMENIGTPPPSLAYESNTVEKNLCFFYGEYFISINSKLLQDISTISIERTVSKSFCFLADLRNIKQEASHVRKRMILCEMFDHVELSKEHNIAV